MKDLVRNPIGIIGLFISLIYGCANLLLGSTANILTPTERGPIIAFIVFFPVVVLGAFYCLVAKHHGKLYAPSDYKDDKSFLRTLSPEEREKKLEREIQEALPESREPVRAQPAQKLTIQQQMAELRKTEVSVIAKIRREMGNPEVHRDVAVGNSGVTYDAVIDQGSKLTFIEIKTLRYPMPFSIILDRVLYNAVLASRHMRDFKLILAVVYTFEDKELARMEPAWRNRVEKCPASVELRFIKFKDLETS